MEKKCEQVFLGEDKAVKGTLLFTGGRSERYALEKGFPGLRVSDAETLSSQESAKSKNKNTELASLRQLYFCS